METVTTPRLVERLRHCSELWARANRSSVSRLGRLAVRDSSFFVSRTGSPRGVTTATLERFAEFLLLRDQWPDGEVPDDVRRFAHVVGITTPPFGLSTGQSDAMSGGDIQ